MSQKVTWRTSESALADRVGGATVIVISRVLQWSVPASDVYMISFCGAMYVVRLRVMVAGTLRLSVKECCFLSRPMKREENSSKKSNRILVVRFYMSCI